MSSSCRALNAATVLPPGLLRQLQDRFDGRGVLLYLPARRPPLAPSASVMQVQALTTAGHTAAQIAAQMGISLRQVYRLRREARLHPERVIVPTPSPAPAPPRGPSAPPSAPAAPPRPKRRRRPTTPRQLSPTEADRAAEACWLQRGWIGDGPPPPIERPTCRPLLVDRTDW